MSSGMIVIFIVDHFDLTLPTSSVLHPNFLDRKDTPGCSYSMYHTKRVSVDSFTLFWDISIAITDQ